MQDNFYSEIKSIVGDKNLIVDEGATQKYSKGFRFGGGKAACVILPRTMLEMWNVLQACVKADVVIIMQAANTGLNGGSTPFGDYDREVVIVSTMQIKGLQLLNDATQVVALGGTTLFELEDLLNQYNRDPHSVIGSSNLGASVIGGICNNSGGALSRRGPAYTQMSLYARLDENRNLHLVNELGINLGETPEEILTNLENAKYTKDDIENPKLMCSDKEYSDRLRQVDEAEPSRFNNDPRRLYGASGSAGRVAVFAVRVDTFAKAKQEQVFYIGTKDPDVLIDLRYEILTKFKNMPVLGEFMHRGYFDVARKYGKDSIFLIKMFGSSVMPKMFKLKNWIDEFIGKLPFVPSSLGERVLQWFSYILPRQLPKRMIDINSKYEHHLILKMADEGIEEARELLQEYFKTREGDYFEATQKEGEKAILNRFVAGAAFKRYYALNKSKLGSMMALDIALKRNDKNWFETLPEEIDKDIANKCYCGHFMCLVMHQDYILEKGVDATEMKAKLLANFEARGAECPAEHNVGTEYVAKPALLKFYKDLDPTNTFNPGIGITSRNRDWN